MAIEVRVVVIGAPILLVVVGALLPQQTPPERLLCHVAAAQPLSFRLESFSRLSRVGLAVASGQWQGGGSGPGGRWLFALVRGSASSKVPPWVPRSLVASLWLFFVLRSHSFHPFLAHLNQSILRQFPYSTIHFGLPNGSNGHGGAVSSDVPSGVLLASGFFSVAR